MDVCLYLLQLELSELPESGDFQQLTELICVQPESPVSNTFFLFVYSGSYLAE